MALEVNLSTFISGGYTGNTIRWDLYEAGTGILIDSHEEAGPHGQVYNFSFVNNIRDIVYKVKLYSVPPGGTVGNLIKAHNVTVTTSTLIFDADLELIVDGGEDYDPVSGATDVPDELKTLLLGKDYYVMQRGIGQLNEEREIEIVKDTVLGGFSLASGLIFEEGVRYFIKFRPSYVVNPPGTVGGSSPYKDIVIVADDLILASTDFGKLFIVDTSKAVITLSLPYIADTIEKVPIYIKDVSTDPAHKNVVITAKSLESIVANGKDKQTLIIGKGEAAQVIKKETTLYGFTEGEDIKRAGQIELVMYVGVNRVIADGTEYDVLDHPRLKEAMDGLEVGQVVTYTQWASSLVITDWTGTRTVYPYKGFFALSNDGTKLKVPDLQNMSQRALKNIGGADSERLGANLGGGYQTYENKEHSHYQFSNDVVNGDGSPISAITYPVMANEFNSSSSYRIKGKATLPTFGKTSSSGGIETRSENNGYIPVVII